VVQQVLLELGEARPQVADLHPDRVAVQVVVGLGVGLRTGPGPLVPRLPLEDVIGGAVHEDQLHARRLEGVRDRLILRRGFGDRRDDAERRRLLREPVQLRGEGLQSHRQPAVAQLGQQRGEVLAELQVDDLRLLLAEPPDHGQRGGR
jgi:hypothetical protein